ncbi:MFS transporter [Pasteurella sp. PK-2025]|uniref:MFS transporter n=1 Tax=Pasteurella sp. PK-2025 TaxID=3413133 RepID=UPI003C761283
MQNNPRNVAVATMVGTAIEYFDNYIYAMAAVLVFNHQFFHSADPVSNELASLSTLALAFFARPFGAILFGHFGDKIGRKKSLIASLLLMGISTVSIGLLPSYADIGIWATLLLCLCRVGQGIGLGGEWGGAALVAIENAPVDKRARYGIFPQLGAPIGLLLANGAFFAVGQYFGQQALVEWAWRIPFIASVVLVGIGWYVRTKIHESAVFFEAEKQGRTHAFPIKAVFTQQIKPFITGVFLATAGYVLFYILAAFAQIYAKSPTTLSPAGHPMGLGLPASTFTAFLLSTSVIFGIAIAFSGLYADKIGRRRFMQYVSVATLVFGLCLPLFLSEGTAFSVFAFLAIGFTIMGMSFGPMAVLLPELFPTEVRYSGASIAYNLAGILGASVATMVAMKLNANFGLMGVGIYLAANALISWIALCFIPETKGRAL